MMIATTLDLTIIVLGLCQISGPYLPDFRKKSFKDIRTVTVKENIFFIFYPLTYKSLYKVLCVTIKTVLTKFDNCYFNLH